MVKIKPLIDSDILCYEVGFATQDVDESGVVTPLDPDIVNKSLEDKINSIIGDVLFEMELLFGDDVTLLEPEFFLTGDSNFRFDVAKTDPYKGNRLSQKPANFRYIRSCLIFKYSAQISDGIEADDLMLIKANELKKEEDTIPVICSRDKDLRQYNGYILSWETSNCPKGFYHVTDVGFLLRTNSKIVGGGKLWLYHQILTGDVTDNYKGCPKIGDIKAFNLLKDLKTEEDMQKVCLECFEKALGEEGRARMEEQANLAYILNHYGDKWKWLI